VESASWQIALFSFLRFLCTCCGKTERWTKEGGGGEGKAQE
jgi:hypothetical protein